MAELHPAGKYKCVVAETIVGTTEDKGQGSKPYIAVTVQLETGVRMTRALFLSDDALPYTEGQMRVLGWDPVENAWDLSQIHETDLLVGVPTTCQIVHKEYQGKTRAEISWFGDREAGPGAKADAPTIGALTSMLRARMRLTGGAKAAAKPAVQPPPSMPSRPKTPAPAPAPAPIAEAPADAQAPF